jgi:hypothetical protein
MSKKIGFDLQMTGREVEREESKKGDKEWHHRTLMMFNGIIIKFIFIISVYSNYLIPLFSSPGELLSSLCVRRPSVRPSDFFKNLLL